MVDGGGPQLFLENKMNYGLGEEGMKEVGEIVDDGGGGSRKRSFLVLSSRHHWICLRKG